MSKLISLLLVLGMAGMASAAATLEWIGPNGTASPWETVSNWENYPAGGNQVPTNVDTARLYNALVGHTFTDSNVTINTTTAICQKLQMKLLTCKLTIPTGMKLTTTGSVEMFQGVSSQLDIQAGATMDACTKANIATATFKLAHDNTAGSYTATVNVWGTLNVISLTPANGTSELDICNLAGGTGTGTLNIYSTGVVNVDAYNIGTAGTGNIIITIGGTMTVNGDVTAQVNTDIAAGKIAGASGATASCTFSGGKTIITASTGGGPTPPAPPASITYPGSSASGSFPVTWASSTGATSYQLERSSNGGGSWVQVSSSGATSYMESITTGSYRYRVKATNSAGTSAYTTGSFDCVVFIPPPASAGFYSGTAAGWDFGQLLTDIAKNNTVDLSDLNIIAQQWLATGCGSTNQWCSGADLDSSSGIDLIDYALLAADWQQQAGKNILLQTIYGSNQDASGNIIYPGAYHALSVGKECLMVFAVPQATALDKGWFKITGLKASYTLRVRLYNVTGQSLLTRSHTIAKASLDTSSPLIDITLPTGSSPVPSHTEGTQSITDLIVNFGPLEVPAGEYMITFNNAGGGNTIGSIIRGAGATVADLMGRDGLGGPVLPKRATVTTTAAVGNTYFYSLESTSATSYVGASNLLACQITTTIVNHPPQVNAGSNQTIQAPDAANLSGTANDDGYPNPLTTTWSKFSGPGTVTFGDVSALSTTAAFSDVGTYVLMLTATDGALSSTSLVTITYTNNSAPAVNAGLDKTVGILDATSLAGTVTDDGLPNPPAAVTTTWTQTSGPGTATFGSASNVNTSVSFSDIGTYVLRLTANDSDLESFDEVTIDVVAGSLNDAPVVNAGPDRIVAAPATVATLSGTATDDGRPTPPGHLTVTWSQQSGPGTVAFGNASLASTTATADTYGTYVLRLTATDGTLTTYDEATVTFKSITYQGYDCNNCATSDLSTCTQNGLTTGGDGGAIVHVTTLADSGAGSLRAALDGLSGSPTKIVFDVGGTINVTSGSLLLDPSGGHVTIAGETAPAPGITLNGGSIAGGATLVVHSHNVIVRNIRVRGNAVGREIIQVMGWYNIIIDHCSVTGGGDGVIDINGGTNQIIVSWCIIANGTEAHRSYGNYASLHHNFYYGNNRRQPKIVTQAGPYDWRNNVMENWTGTGTNLECMTVCTHQVNVVNNYYGPNTSGKAPGNEFHIDPNTWDIYIAGNVVPDGDPDINLKGDRSTPNAEPNFPTVPADLNLVADVKGHCGAMPRDSYDQGVAGPAAP